MRVTDASAVLITVTGRDRPGITAALCAALEDHSARILDMEQVVIHDRLILGILVSVSGDEALLNAAVGAIGEQTGMQIEIEQMASRRAGSQVERHSVVLLGQPLRPAAVAALTAVIADEGGNIDRIERLSRYPITSFELTVSGADGTRLREGLATEAANQRVDVAVQPANLYRRAKRLIVMDVDSTLVQDEAIELLADELGCVEKVREITTRAMEGELDFAESLRERVQLLAGCPVEVLDRVRDRLRLTPGAPVLARTLRRLGFTTAIVSGGFRQIVDPIRRQLGLDFAVANELEIIDGRLTGRLLGDIIDRAGKADALRSLARTAGVPINQTVAVGDGANDLDMLSIAGLGIAFNAKPVLRAAADTTVTVPYLDAILFLLGITREEIDAAELDDPFAEPAERP
ncbi:MAG: phosphoserine phosphatase SerB [Actinobacteria bacterium]|nr:phosphoserine phosphatase SerB [Actinomycetota bacterium]